MTDTPHGVSVVNNHVYCELRPTTDTYSKKGQTYGSLCCQEGREHPVLQGVLGEHLGIGDMVSVAIALFAIDDDAKHVEDGIAVAVEGAACHGEPATHLGLHPVVVDLLEGEALMAVDGVDEPDVFFEEVGGLHGGFFFFF